MDSKNILTINVDIAGQRLQLHIDPKDEGRIREAAKLITKTFENYKDKFATFGYTHSNLLAMATLNLLVEKDNQTNPQEDSPLMDELYLLEENLEEFIEEKL
jgi:cell division protein ZapA (FtsZ GTPase activity inhibitor)